MKLLILFLLQLIFFLSATSLKKCLIKQFIDGFLVFDSIPDQQKTEEICGIVASSYPFLVAHWPVKYKTHRICDESEAVDDSVAALKPIIDWFVTNKIIKKLYTALYPGDGLPFFGEDSANVTFFCNKMGNFLVNYNNINLENNSDDDSPDTIILTRFWLGIANANHFKKIREELMAIAWHPKI